MANIKTIDSHASNKLQSFILYEDKSFLIVYKDKHSVLFTENDSISIVNQLTCFETAKKIAALKVGRAVNSKLIVALSENSDITAGKYQFVTIEISTDPMAVWGLRVYVNGEVIDLPTGCVDDIYRHLISVGINKAKSFGTYNNIKFISKLPTEATQKAIGTAYVLTSKDEDKEEGTAWVWTGKRFEEVTEEPKEADPADSTTIPDSVVKEEIQSSDIGSSTEHSVQVWDKAVSGKTTVNASEEATVVNSTLSDGNINITVA